MWERAQIQALLSEWPRLRVSTSRPPASRDVWRLVGEKLWAWAASGLIRIRAGSPRRPATRRMGAAPGPASRAAP